MSHQLISLAWICLKKLAAFKSFFLKREGDVKFFCFYNIYIFICLFVYLFIYK